MNLMDGSTPQDKNRFVFSEAPLLVYWEITRACDLACLHCRAGAINSRDVFELSTSEGEDLIEEMREFGTRLPHLVVTGGDPLKRDDVFELLEHAADRGFPVSVVPSATKGLTRETLQRFRAAGVESIALSLDGSDAERHDGLRGVAGCFGETLAAMRLALAADLALQVNTLVTADTLADLPRIYELLRTVPLMRWKLFSLIEVGRGRMLRSITPGQCEELHRWIYDISKEAPFPVATTEAPHFRRLALTRMREEGISMSEIRKTSVGRGFGIRDGNGVVFISHSGDVYPSGFLPLRGGNVRTSSAAAIYRDSEIFRSLRRTAGFKGRCGICQFREVCGGSRARAYAATGDLLESDPLCAYDPVEARS